jgi:hypothetical protein
MAHKNALVRITQTLNFIANTNAVPLATRTQAHAFAQAFITNRYPAMHAAQPGYVAFSDRMSLGWHFFDDPNEYRKMCRAIYLLWSAMHDADNNFNMPVQNAGQIVQATAVSLLDNVARKARILHEVPGNTTGLQQALADLQNNPLWFLRENKVFVVGSPYQPAHGNRNIVGCNFRYNLARDRYEFWVRAPTANSLPIQVESVYAQHWTESQPGAPYNIATANFGNLQAVELSGAHMMVTTQFTGCSFCMKEVGGIMYCAHVSPASPTNPTSTTGPLLAQRVIATGDFANAAGHGQFRVYGRDRGTAPFPNGYNIGAIGSASGSHTYMTIVGFHAGTSYEIYSQVTVGNRIAGAYQIA